MIQPGSRGGRRQASGSSTEGNAEPSSPPGREVHVLPRPRPSYQASDATCQRRQRPRPRPRPTVLLPSCPQGCRAEAGERESFPRSMFVRASHLCGMLKASKTGRAVHLAEGLLRTLHGDSSEIERYFRRAWLNLNRVRLWSRVTRPNCRHTNNCGVERFRRTVNHDYGASIKSRLPHRQLWKIFGKPGEHESRCLLTTLNAKRREQHGRPGHPADGEESDR